MNNLSTNEKSFQEVTQLRQKLAEVQEHLRLAQETLEAIHSGEVDAILVANDQGEEKVFTLQGADHVYQRLVEQMGEGAATISEEGLILYGNQKLSELLNCPLKNLIGSQLETFIIPKDRKAFRGLLQQVKEEETLTIELSLLMAIKLIEIPVKLTIKQFKIDDILISSVVITDLTDYQRKQEVKLSNILNRAIAAITSYRLLPDRTWIFDSWSGGCKILLGYTAEELMADQTLWANNIISEDLEIIFSQLVEEDKLEKISNIEYRFRHQDGTVRWIGSSDFFEWDEINNCSLGTSVLTDITQRKQAEIALQESEAKYRLLFESNPSPLWVVDLETLNFLAINKDAIAHYGYSKAEFLSMKMIDLFPSCDLNSIDELRDKLTAEQNFWGVWRHLTKDENLINVEISTHTFLLLDQQVALVVINDITERLQAQMQIEHLAFYDLLTNLPNRHLLFDRLEHAIALTQRSGNYGALLFIDLDRFKRINDAKGHAVGDMLLQEVATRLKDSLRQVDTVARFGGDEFVVVLPELGSEEAIATQLSVNIGEKICAKLSDSFILEGEKIRIGASIGITLFYNSEKTVNHLLKEADIAMYQAKASGSNMVRLFETTMQRDVEFHFALDNELRHALKKNQFLVYLQPQVDKESRLVGAEALIRWSHPVMGMVPPGTFIPITEENGLIISIGEWVLQETCQYLASIQASGSRLQISVNVSPYQFRQSTFVSRVKAIVAATGIDATFLTLEVTEGLIIADIHQAIATMSALKVLGIHFSIDDFGTGYSSLPYLKRLLLNELKIDQSFVQDLPSETALIEAIIAIARHFKFAIVAEGVETIEQANFLKQRGCDFYQGYLYGKPMPIDEFDLMRIAALV